MNVPLCQPARNFCLELMHGNPRAIARTVAIALGVALILGAVLAHAFSGGTAPLHGVIIMGAGGGLIFLLGSFFCCCRKLQTLDEARKEQSQWATQVRERATAYFTTLFNNSRREKRLASILTPEGEFLPDIIKAIEEFDSAKLEHFISNYDMAQCDSKGNTLLHILAGVKIADHDSIVIFFADLTDKIDLNQANKEGLTPYKVFKNNENISHLEDLDLLFRGSDQDNTL